MQYKHILFVTDLLSDSQKVADKARQIRSSCEGSKLSVVHIVLDNIIAGGYEVIPLFNYIDDKENIQENAKALDSFLETSGLRADNSEVISALSTASGIVDYATEKGVDLIVTGLHKKQGLFNNLLGNTATSILNNSICDVLTVVIDPKDEH